MKRIYLFCSAGMSTSLVAKRMQEVADKHSLPVEVKAFPDNKIDVIVEEFHPDVILFRTTGKVLSLNRQLQNTNHRVFQ